MSSSSPAEVCDASWGAASCAAGAAPASPLRNALRALTIGSLSSVPSSWLFLMLSTYVSNASRHWKSTSTMAELTFIFSLRTSENTFSILCVRFCILLYPIVPAIPFKECAARNISLMVSLLSGSLSRIKICSLRLCRCSFDSSIKISKYWLTSILRPPSHFFSNILPSWYIIPNPFLLRKA